MPTNTDESNELNNPHDKFFKRALAMAAIARPMLEKFLPTDVLDKLNLDTLEIDPNSYINDELKETFSDIVWSCQLKNSHKKRKIAFLFEHKSYKPDYPHFQLIDYQRNSWRIQINEGQLPVPILPIIFYHGLEKWVVRPFESYFGEVEAEMLQFLPSFNYILINLQDYSEEQIRNINDILLQKTLLGFKFYKDKDYLNDHIVELIFMGYGKLKNEQAYTFMRIFVVYLTAVSGINREEIIVKANKMNNMEELEFDIIEDLKEAFREKWLEKGMEKGMEKGKKISIYEAALRGHSLELLSNVFGLPVETITQIIAEMKNETTAS
jgi:predicted transposase/invertase (TIGR01784 family)